MSMTFLTGSALESRKIGRKLAGKILKNRAGKKAEVLALVGDLGGGKTTFIQGLARGLGIKEKVLSPTFIIMRRMKVQKPGCRFKNFYHIDCYRIINPRDIFILDFKKILTDPQNIVAIEWADKIKGILPKDVFWLHFNFINAKTRRITIK